MVATDILERTRLPGVDPWASFNDGSLRGPVILFRGLAALTLGIVVGAVMGRQLPALIVAGLLTLVVVGAVPLATQAYARTLAEWQPAEGTIGSVDMVFDFGYRDRATGEVLAYDEAYARAPVIPDVGPDEDWLATHYEPVSQVVVRAPLPPGGRSRVAPARRCRGPVARPVRRRGRPAPPELIASGPAVPFGWSRPAWLRPSTLERRPWPNRS